MKITDIEPDKVYVMDDSLHGLFLSGGCDPTCHCCNTKIPIGAEYKLGTVTELDIANAYNLAGTSYLFKSEKQHEIMLCGNVECTAKMMVKNAIERKEAHLEWKRSRGGGCSIIDGKIVP